MATASKRPELNRYFIRYGFGHSPIHSRRFRAAMTAAGFQLAKTIDQADIVIAHSAGTWSLPADLPARLIVLVGMALQTDHNRQTLLRANRTSLQLDGANEPGRYLLQTGLGVLNVLRQPYRHSHIIHQAQRQRPLPSLPNEQVVFIMNRADPWPRFPQLKRLLATAPFSFISLPGSHNDIWYSPAAYIAIMEHYARLLATADR